MPGWVGAAVVIVSILVPAFFTIALGGYMLEHAPKTWVSQAIWATASLGCILICSWLSSRIMKADQTPGAG